MSLGDSLTWADWTRLVAAEHGVTWLTDADVDFILWERTPWPASTDPRDLRACIHDTLDRALAVGYLEDEALR